MVCNLLTVSRRCPICRNEVSRLDLDDDGTLVPLSPSGIKLIRSCVDMTFGEGCGSVLIPDGCVSFLDHRKGWSNIIVNGGEVGRLSDGKVTLDLAGLKAIQGKMVKNYVRCDHDSSYFVKKGRNLMVTGITELSASLEKGDQVAIIDDRGEVIASGIMRMSSSEMGTSDRGVAVSIRSSDVSRTCYGIPGHDWNDTLEKNASSMSSTVGMAVKGIRELASSYGDDVIVRFTGDIRTEALLFLTMDSGLVPRVKIDDRDDFTDFIMDRCELNAVDVIPDGCLLIIDTTTEQNDAKNVTHCPILDWEPSFFWLYIMLKKEPFSHYYLNICLNTT